MKSKARKHKSKSKKIIINPAWEPVNAHAAGVDIGSAEHWACAPTGSGQTAVRKFGTFTADLEAMAEWFQQCGVTSVAMEATGVCWIPLFQILERRGFEVVLVNARQTKNVTCRTASGFSGCTPTVCSRRPSDRRMLTVCCARICVIGMNWSAPASRNASTCKKPCSK
jgi:hypothetical protein